MFVGFSCFWGGVVRTLGYPQLVSAGLLLAIFGCAWLYWPALTGPFLLDDFLHLQKLKGQGVVDELSFYNFIGSGTTHLGRILSFLSLLINDVAWPSNAQPFKYTNLMMHCLNGVLVFVLIRKFPSFQSPKGNYIALFAMFLWLVHPFQMSTVMYVIQRITILSSTAMLLVLICYVHGRVILSSGRRVPGLLWMTVGLAVFGVVGLFFKETTIAVLFYIWAIEATLFSDDKVPEMKYWMGLFIWAPLSLVLGYVLVNLEIFNTLTYKYEWTISERVITEPKILAEYAYNFFAPRLSAFSLYHDDYAASKGLLNPISTLFCVILWVATFILACCFRRRYKILAFSVLFFLGGHALEASPLPIELYFEHRNYLPILGFCVLVVNSALSITKRYRVIAAICLGFYLTLMCAQTRVSAEYWGDASKLAVVWNAERAGSLRAGYDYFNYLLEEGRIDEAEAVISELADKHPRDASTKLYRALLFHCDEEWGADLQNDLLTAVSNSKVSVGLLTALDYMGNHLKSDGCPGTTEEFYLLLLQAYVANPKLAGYPAGIADMSMSEAKIHYAAGDLDKTIKALDNAFELTKNFRTKLLQAEILASAGLHDEAQQFFDDVSLSKVNNIADWYYRRLLMQKSKIYLDYARKSELKGREAEGVTGEREQ